MRSLGLNLFSYLKIVRVPNLLIIVLAQYFTAIFIVGTSETWRTFMFDRSLFLISLSTILIAAAGYIINDYFDIKIDYINKPHRVIVGKEIKRRHAMAAHTILNLSAVFIGFLVHPVIALINAASATMLWWYSNSLKRKPLVGNFIVALLTALCLLLLAFYYRANEWLIVMYAVFAFGLTLIREIVKDVEDISGDADFGRRTIPVIWGIRKSKWLLFVLSIGFILGLFLITHQLNNPRINTYFYIFLVPMAFFIIKMMYADSKKEFGFLSVFCKFLMLLGIISMVFF
jgi:4-hydroxybenzoate polyprenyltransferase